MMSHVTKTLKLESSSTGSDSSESFEDDALTLARSKLRLCSWKAAELLSAGRIKTKERKLKRNTEGIKTAVCSYY